MILFIIIIVFIVQKRIWISFYTPRILSDYQQNTQRCYGWVVKHDSLVWKVSGWDPCMVACFCKSITSLWTRHYCTLPWFSTNLVTFVHNPIRLVEMCHNKAYVCTHKGYVCVHKKFGIWLVLYLWISKRKRGCIHTDSFVSPKQALNAYLECAQMCSMCSKVFKIIQ